MERRFLEEPRRFTTGLFVRIIGCERAIPLLCSPKDHDPEFHKPLPRKGRSRVNIATNIHGRLMGEIFTNIRCHSLCRVFHFSPGYFPWQLGNYGRTIPCMKASEQPMDMFLGFLGIEPAQGFIPSGMEMSTEVKGSPTRRENSPVTSSTSGTSHHGPPFDAPSTTHLPCC